MNITLHSPTSFYLDPNLTKSDCLKLYAHDLQVNPIATLFYTPKIIHNIWQNRLSPVRDALGIGYMFDLLGKLLKPIFGEAKERKWFTNYFQFGAIANGLQYLYPLQNFPLIGNKIWGSIVGSLLQGYDGCSWQVKISRYPVTAFVTGAINGFLCCTFQNFCNDYVFGRVFSENAASCLSFVTTWALSSKAMCKVEEKVFTAREQIALGQVNRASAGSYFRNLVTNKKETSCCCTKSK